MENNTPEELMKPRYLVIAKYPGMPFRLGDVIHVYGEGFMFPEKVAELYDSCSANFRKLEWWEFREVSEMPEYVSTKDKDYYWKVNQWVIGKYSPYFQYRDSLGEIIYRYSENVLPATLTDYLNFKNKEK